MFDKGVEPARELADFIPAQDLKSLGKVSLALGHILEALADLADGVGDHAGSHEPHCKSEQNQNDDGDGEGGRSHGHDGFQEIVLVGADRKDPSQLGAVKGGNLGFAVIFITQDAFFDIQHFLAEVELLDVGF